MSEKLSVNGSFESAGHYRRHERAAEKLKLAKWDLGVVNDRNKSLVESGEGVTSSDFEKSIDAQSELENAQNAYDANLWRAQKHKNEHFDQYKEQARQDAEDAGVEIELDEPEE